MSNSIWTPWPKWQIEGAPLGRGSYGVVYKAVRRDHGMESYSAIKVISIPQNPGDIDDLRMSGHTEASAKTLLRDIVSDFEREIAIMETFKATHNILSIEDYDTIEKRDSVGWDIYIRMELLKPFSEYSKERSLNEREIIKLGTDICTALELCQKKNIIHRDIKPQNIFINSFGDFKLGDFGIAKRLENFTKSVYSLKGTPKFMAPEVVAGDKYDASVDTYSLGLVLYQLLNNNHDPFLDPFKAPSFSEISAANNRRLNKEPLPSPCNASSELSSIILKACAPEPADRFSSASEMKKALLAVCDITEDLPNESKTPGMPEDIGCKDPETPNTPPTTIIENEDDSTIRQPYAQENKKTSTADDNRGLEDDENNIDGSDPGTSCETDDERYPIVNGDDDNEVFEIPPSIEQHENSGKTPNTKRILIALALIAACAVACIFFTPTQNAKGYLATASSSTFSSVKVGDVYTFGRYEQDNKTSNGDEAIEWIVLAKDERSKSLLLISKYALDVKQYNTEWTEVTWESCTLRKWLNNEFKNAAFSSSEQRMIDTTNITADKNPEYDTNAGNDTSDQVFLLSINEAEKYFSSGDARACAATPYAEAQGAYVNTSNGNCWWWLRSPGYGSYYASYVKTNGGVYCFGHDVHRGNRAVRPALWVNLGS